MHVLRIIVATTRRWDGELCATATIPRKPPRSATKFSSVETDQITILYGLDVRGSREVEPQEERQAVGDRLAEVSPGEMAQPAERTP